MTENAAVGAAPSKPVIILVEPQLGDNIGMVARAMANFGLSDLRLVTPRDGWPNERARATASKADHVIDAVTVFDSLPAAIADLNFVLATTARQRDGHKEVLGPVEACQRIGAMGEGGSQSGILFGRERWGLNNEEIGQADAIVTFPVDPAFASLNIAQAVLLMAYELSRGRSADTNFSAPDRAPAQKQVLNAMFDWLEPALDQRGYFRTEQKKPKMMENLRAVLTRPGFSADEIAVLRGVFTALDRFRPRGAKTESESQ
ncbi:RNA methyltransferase [Notoacmeibacter sp. MSK16QG-6]|uniref:RNA methyltransferase n=1 Tax=Notoacmeibacter sp. MSK16QG-6 TaxID=2957982 RepID=UPI0020A079E9|nr:RNA methyltransferase [Notoacmeibacter sp. MSK16QG-6]MCP1199465.1 RNA methyltransferase [Notoacmeibacter sp. MSK16QG-6]